jgi:hypothetical protein
VRSGLLDDVVRHALLLDGAPFPTVSVRRFRKVNAPFHWTDRERPI